MSNTQDGDFSREAAIALIWRGSIRSMDRICDDLSRPDNTLEQVTFWLAELITRRPLTRYRGTIHPDAAFTAFKKKHQRQADSGFLRDIIVKPAGPNSIRFRVIELFEEDYGDIREVFEFLAQQRGLDAVGYFDKLVKSMARITKNRRWVRRPETMFDGSFLAALKKRMAKGVRLKEISGLTNTHLLLYEWAFEPEHAESNGFASVTESSYDVGFDLGGGFATQYLSKRLQQPLTCLDLFDPRTRSRAESGHVRRAYKKVGLEYDPDACPYQRFDVYEDAYPDVYDTYLITSFGFLGSTPGDVSNKASGDEPRSYATTYAAVLGLAKLILAGKDVTLCVYSRPSATRFANLCYTLRFADGVLKTARTISSDSFMEYWIIERMMSKGSRYKPFSRG